MMTVADFLDWPGDGLGTRFELIDGELRAMAPASETHGIVPIRGVRHKSRFATAAEARHFTAEAISSRIRMVLPAGPEGERK